MWTLRALAFGGPQFCAELVFHSISSPLILSKMLVHAIPTSCRESRFRSLIWVLPNSFEDGDWLKRAKPVTRDEKA